MRAKCRCENHTEDRGRAGSGRHGAVASAGHRRGEAGGVTRGRRFRVDTTVVETNVHYPTDRTLLQDGVRVLTRTMHQASTALGDQPGAGAESAAERDTPGADDRLPGGVAENPGRVDRELPKADGHDPRRAAGRAHHGASDRPGPSARRRRPVAILDRAHVHLQRMRPLVERVIHQTRARLLGGDTHVPDKVLSFFEPHTATIRKGKMSKPNEFGSLVTIQESEQQIITAYEVHTRTTRGCDLVDVGAWIGTRPSSAARQFAAGDRGFSSAANEQAATDRGVRRVVLPRRGPKSASRRAYSGRPGSGAANGGVSAVRAHQRDQTAPWTPTLSLSGRRRDASLGRPRGHRRQLDQHGDGPRPPGGRVTNRRGRRPPSHPPADESTPGGGREGHFFTGK